MSLARLLREPPPEHGSCNGQTVFLKPSKLAVVPKHIVIGRRIKSHKAQGGICYYCHKPTHIGKWTMDHRIPSSRGGGGGKNLVGCCATCNHDKGDKTEFEYREFLKQRQQQRESEARIDRIRNLLKL